MFGATPQTDKTSSFCIFIFEVQKPEEKKLKGKKKEEKKKKKRRRKRRRKRRKTARNPFSAGV